MEKEFIDKDKQQAIEDYRTNHDRLYRRGKVLVMVIAVVNIFAAILSVISDFNLIVLGVQVA